MFLFCWLHCSFSPAIRGVAFKKVSSLPLWLLAKKHPFPFYLLKGTRLKIVTLEYVQASVVANFFRLKKALFSTSAQHQNFWVFVFPVNLNVAQIPSPETEVFGVLQPWKSFYLNCWQGYNNYKDVFSDKVLSRFQWETFLVLAVVTSRGHSSCSQGSPSSFFSSSFPSVVWESHCNDLSCVY